ncbi:MAG: LptF/LptG family permease, partial [Pirellulales bacterium]
IAKEAVDNGLGLVPILRMIPYMLPQAMQFAVPGTMLLATTSVYGRIASSNEIVAVKSLGISPMAMVWPTLILATVVSMGAVVLNDVAVSWGHEGVQRVVLESLEEIVYGRLQTTGSFSSNNNQLNVTVEDVQGKKLVRPTIFYHPAHSRLAWIITADWASLRADVPRGAVSLTLVNAEVDFGDGRSANHPGNWELTISLDDFSGRQQRSRNPANFPLREIGPSIVEQRASIEQSKQEMAAQVAHSLATGRMFELSEDLWQRHARRLDSGQKRLYRLNTEPHRRWANGFSCLCFVMIGAPMAVRRRHGEFWGSFFACFLPILIVYYPMLVGCVDGAKTGTLPPQAVWLGNVVLACWGIWLLRRVVRF